MMVSGEGCLIQGNYIHDLIMGVDAAPGVDPNMVGGAEGIFINASNVEVSYNSFVNCIGGAEWVGQEGGCDGGATEVTVRSGETLTNVSVHHNFSYNNCGFFEAATGFGGTKGLFSDSVFHNNVIIDSGWMGLLQVNNTDLSNIHYYNNTLVQRQGSANAGLLWIIFTDTSSGMTGGELVPGTVSLTNNLFVFDGVTTFGEPIDPAFDQTTNLIINSPGENPGFVNILGTSAADFDLTDSSPAINVGTLIASNTLDYLNRPVWYVMHHSVPIPDDCLPQVDLLNIAEYVAYLDTVSNSILVLHDDEATRNEVTYQILGTKTNRDTGNPKSSQNRTYGHTQLGKNHEQGEQR